jgi:toxin ParE1/3/4
VVETAGWRIRLGAAAEVDFANIVTWTAQEFGARQAGLYRETLVNALAELGRGPEVAGSMARDEIASGLRSLHVARRGRRGRHFILYRVAPGRLIEIVRILHDSMDTRRHLPEE